MALIATLFMINGGLTHISCAEEAPPETSAVLTSIRTFADNLIAHGRDGYGPKHTPLFVCQLDIATKKIPPAKSMFYAQERNRGGARSTANNLQFDSGLVRLLEGLTELDFGPQYRAAAREYLAYYFEHLPDPKHGLWPWGDHRGYDVVADKTIRGYHEFKVMNPPWDVYWTVNSNAVMRAIEGLHLHIFDPRKSYGFNRHYPSRNPYTNSMMSSGGAWIASWAYLYGKTGDPKYLDWAEKMDAYLWSLRNPKTDLLASHPADPAYPAWRKYHGGRRATRTEYMAQLIFYAHNLLIAADRLGPEKGKPFREHALRYVRSFIRHMDIRDGSFFATFELASGKPLFPRITDGWEFVPQMNDKYKWGNRVLGIRAPVSIAYAFRVTGEADLREAFDALLPLYRMEQFTADAARADLPAGLIAETMTSFIDMYKGTRDAEYLGRAETLGAHAMKHYYVDGWFVAGPPVLERHKDKQVDGWTTYANRGGSAELALALLRLTLVREGKGDFLGDNPRSYF